MKNRYEIRGKVTAIYINTKGVVVETLIDTEDLIAVSSVKGTWGISCGYVITTKQINHKREVIQLHRILMDAPKEKFVDHKDGNPLNNMKNNLRLATPAENSQNRKDARVDSKTGIRGVMWDEKGNKWRAKATIDGKTYFRRFKHKGNAEKFVKDKRSTLMPFSHEFGATFGNIPEELPVNNSSGFKGVSWNSSLKKWKATIKKNNRAYHIGYFDDPAAAYEKIVDKKQSLELILLGRFL